MNISVKNISGWMFLMRQHAKKSLVEVNPPKSWPWKQNDTSCAYQGVRNANFLENFAFILNELSLTLFRMGGGQKAPPTSFFPVSSTNVGISPQKFLTFSFNPFAKLV